MAPQFVHFQHHGQGNNDWDCYAVGFMRTCHLICLCGRIPRRELWCVTSIHCIVPSMDELDAQFQTLFNFLHFFGYFLMTGTPHPGFHLWYDTADAVSEEWQAAIWPGKATSEHGAAHHSQLQPRLSGKERDYTLESYTLYWLNISIDFQYSYNKNTEKDSTPYHLLLIKIRNNNRWAREIVCKWSVHNKNRLHKHEKNSIKADHWKTNTLLRDNTYRLFGFREKKPLVQLSGK